MKTKKITIPTLLGIFLIVVFLGAVTVFTNYFLKGNAIAHSDLLPNNLTITSVTDSGFTITWETNKPSLSAVTITDPQGKQQTFFDERYFSSETKKYITASIPVRGLLPDTEYKMKLIINGKPYTDLQQSMVRTGPKLSSDTNGMTPIYGSVTTAENIPADGALVFASYGEDSQILSTLVKPSGYWIIPLNLLRSEDLTRLIQKTDERQQISITIRLAGKQTTILTDTLNASPVPPVVLGNTYDFRGQQTKKKTNDANQKIASSFSSVLGTFSPQENNHAVQLISPPQNGYIPGDPPLFSGRGIPGNIVTLLFGTTNPKVETTTVLPDGTWQFSPKKPLGAGKQRVTATTLDGAKNPVAITHLFEIMKSGTQVLGDATPSATLIPTATATPIPTTIVAATDTPTPTQTVPTTANTLPANVLFVLGIGLLIAGILTLAL
jgi:hypothetical protein